MSGFYRATRARSDNTLRSDQYCCARCGLITTWSMGRSAKPVTCKDCRWVEALMAKECAA